MNGRSRARAAHPAPPPLPAFTVSVSPEREAEAARWGATIDVTGELLFGVQHMRVDRDLAIVSCKWGDAIVLAFRRPGGRNAKGRLFVFRRDAGIVRRALEIARGRAPVARVKIGTFFARGSCEPRVAVWVGACGNGDRSIVFERVFAPNRRPCVIDVDLFDALERALAWLEHERTRT